MTGAAAGGRSPHNVERDKSTGIPHQGYEVGTGSDLIGPNLEIKKSRFVFVIVASLLFSESDALGCWTPSKENAHNVKRASKVLQEMLQYPKCCKYRYKNCRVHSWGPMMYRESPPRGRYTAHPHPGKYESRTACTLRELQKYCKKCCSIPSAVNIDIKIAGYIAGVQ